MKSELTKYIFDLALDQSPLKLQDCTASLGKEIPNPIPLPDPARTSCLWSYLIFVRLHEKIKASRKFYKMDQCCVCRICFQPIRFVSAKKSLTHVLNHYSKSRDLEHQQAHVAYCVESGSTSQHLSVLIDSIGFARNHFICTVLLQAARCNLRDIADWAIRSESTAHHQRHARTVTNSDGNSFLHLAVQHRSVAILHGPDFFSATLVAENRRGETPLEMACRCCDEHAVADLFPTDQPMMFYMAHWGEEAALDRMGALAAGPGAWSRHVVAAYRTARCLLALRRMPFSAAAIHEHMIIIVPPSCGDLTAFQAWVEAQPWWVPSGHPDPWPAWRRRELFLAVQQAARAADGPRLACLLDRWGAPLRAPADVPPGAAGLGVGDYAALGGLVHAHEPLETQASFL
jgi:hypothetical protein